MAAVKQISVRQLDGTYLSNPIGADANNVDIDENTSLADKVPEWNSKVDSEEGKGLSTNDYTTEEKNKLETVSANAEANIINSISINGIQQAVVDKDVDLSDSFNSKADLDIVADDYDSSKSYSVDDYIIYRGKLFKCVEDHSEGEWDDDHFIETQIAKEIKKDSGIVIQAEPPLSENVLWIDISGGDAKGIAKYYLNGTWNPCQSIWG